MGGGCVGLNFFLGGWGGGGFMRDDFQAACWIWGIRCLGFSGCIVNGVGNELPALRFIFRLPQTRFQAAFVNSVRSEAAHPMAVGISCVRRFQAACWDVCANCFQAASNSFSGCLVNSVRSEAAHPTAKPVFRLPIRFSSDIYWTASVRGDTTLGQRVCWGVGCWRS